MREGKAVAGGEAWQTTPRVIPVFGQRAALAERPGPIP